ncbi:hydrolase [Vallicoccus soli]|uniref:Hydrolase n=1 Tax=Vallicoccus soli TaxID=2339232 RepID=A0A3A3Z4S3_9ACTN|nr:hydrolase [Vallicoccus soli]
MGEAAARVHPAPEPRAVLLLGHGAGGRSDGREVLALAAALPSRGVSVVLVDQPWRVAGRRVAAPPPVLDRAWRAAVPQVLERVAPAPLWLGGRSAGARVACRTAAELGAAAVAALAFPLHPPGRPERSRLPELALPPAAGVRLLVVQGERDPFGAPAEFPPGYDVRPAPAADHAFRVPRGAAPDQAAVLAGVVEAVASLLEPLPR